MVIPAASVVPSHNNDRIRPILAVSNRVDDGSDPGGTSRRKDASRMVRILASRDYPTHRRQLRIRDVDQDRREIELSVKDDMFFPIGPTQEVA